MDISDNNMYAVLESDDPGDSVCEIKYVERSESKVGRSRRYAMRKMTTEVNVSKREDSVVQLNRANPSENVLTDLPVSVQRGKIDEDNFHFFYVETIADHVPAVKCLLCTYFKQSGRKRMFNTVRHIYEMFM